MTFNLPSFDINIFLEKTYYAVSNTDIPSHAGIIALVTIITTLLIPIAVFLLDEKNNKYFFDKNVILEKIIMAKCLIPLIIFNAILLVFNFETKCKVLSIVFAMFFLIPLIFLLVCVLCRTYRWMSTLDHKQKITYKQGLRLEYLKSLKTDEQKREVWSLILNDKDLSEKNQIGLIKTIVDTCLKDENKPILKHEIISSLRYNIRKIDPANFENIKCLLEWLVYNIADDKQDTNFKYQQKKLLCKLFDISVKEAFYTHWFDLAQKAYNRLKNKEFFIEEVLPELLDNINNKLNSNNKEYYATVVKCLCKKFDWRITEEGIKKNAICKALRESIATSPITTENHENFTTIIAPFFFNKEIDYRIITDINIEIAKRKNKGEYCNKSDILKIFSEKIKEHNNKNSNSIK